jgi:hypothetical protein
MVRVIPLPIWMLNEMPGLVVHNIDYEMFLNHYARIYDCKLGYSAGFQKYVQH